MLARIYTVFQVIAAEQEYTMLVDGVTAVWYDPIRLCTVAQLQGSQQSHMQQGPLSQRGPQVPLTTDHPAVAASLGNKDPAKQCHDQDCQGFSPLAPCPAINFCRLWATRGQEECAVAGGLMTSLHHATCVRQWTEEQLGGRRGELSFIFYFQKLPT